MLFTTFKVLFTTFIVLFTTCTLLITTFTVFLTTFTVLVMTFTVFFTTFTVLFTTFTVLSYLIYCPTLEQGWMSQTFLILNLDDYFSFLPSTRAQRDGIRSQTIHSKETPYDITQTKHFFTKYGAVCPFKRTFGNSRGTAYHIL